MQFLIERFTGMSFPCGGQGQAFGSQPRIPSNSTFSDVTLELGISAGGNMDTVEISQHYTAGLFPPAEPADRHSQHIPAKAPGTWELQLTPS